MLQGQRPSLGLSSNEKSNIMLHGRVEESSLHCHQMDILPDLADDLQIPPSKSSESMDADAGKRLYFVPGT